MIHVNTDVTAEVECQCNSSSLTEGNYLNLREAGYLDDRRLQGDDSDNGGKTTSGESVTRHHGGTGSRNVTCLLEG